MKKGISLIVLVITIIVIIILAGAVILSLSKNNPISSAEEATFKSDLSTYKSELLLHLTSEFTKAKGNLNSNTIYASNTVADINSGKTIKQIITSMTDVDASEYIIYNGKLVYVGSNTNKKSWAKDSSNTSSYINDGLVLSLDGKDFASNAVTNLWIDRSGNNNHATPKSFDYTVTSGNAGDDSVAFDGINDYAVVSNPVRDANVFTIGFWIKHNSPSLWSDIFTFDTGVDGTAGRVEYTGGTDYRWYVGGIFPSGTILFTHDGTAYDYIVIKCDGTNAYCYKNGVITYSGVKSSGNLPTCDIINIGRRLTGSNWKGNIKNIHFYNRALSSAEIIQNYNSNL